MLRRRCELSELDEVMKTTMAPFVRGQKILQRAKELKLSKKDIEKMSEKEIQKKFGDL